MNETALSNLQSLAQICRNISDSPIEHRYRRSLVDAAVRAASTIVSTGGTKAFCSTGSILQWNRFWSDEAIDLYYNLKGSKTHRQTVHVRIDGRRPWTLEHRYPLNIIKHEIYDGASPQAIVDWMIQYGYSVVILHSQQPELQSCKTLEAAKDRYANISFKVHPHFEQ